MDAQRCANTLKPSKQVFSFRKESKTTVLTKSKPSCHVLSCLAMLHSKLFAKSELDVCIINNRCLFILSVGLSSFLIEFYMPLRSVSLIWESFIYGLGFNSQTLNGCLQFFTITLQQGDHAETTTDKDIVY